MGIDTRRRPTLPAPTESIVDTTGSMTGTDLATDVSRRTDKSSYSIPDDGSPITISTRRRSQKREGDESSKLSRSSHHSQTSLLIEYFEGGKSGSHLSSRPSVRVKVTPSAARKLRDQDDHIQISESSGKKPIYTRRISLGTSSKQKAITGGPDDQSITSDEQGMQPVEIEFVDRDNSELSNDRYIQPTSEISTMPPDSMLEGSMASATPRRKRSQSLDKAEAAVGAVAAADLLKAPARRRSRSLSRERIAYKVAQKINAGEGTSGGRRRSSRSATKDLLDTESKSTKKRSHKHRDEEAPSADSSLLSGSGLSSRYKSGDAISFRSGTSRSSLNNPKLLETVEDAIRRLILPELKELKKDQKITTNKSKFEQHIASGSSTTSKDELGRRLSKHSSAPDVSKSSILLATGSKEVASPVSEERRRRHKERKREREQETVSPDEKLDARRGSRPDYTEEEMLRRQRSRGLRDAAAAGIVGTALTTAALKHHDSKSSLDKKERRRRRTKSRSRSASIHDSDTELVFQKHNVPPMPMRSEIDSELTRDSILSQRTDGTEVANEIREVVRGSPRGLESPSSRTPTARTPTRTPLGNRREVNSRQSNHSDREVRSKTGSPLADMALGEAAGAIAAAAAANLLGYHPDHDMLGSNHAHHHPRALSPIQSVASDHDIHEFDEADASAGQSRDLKERRFSIESLSSAPSTDLARSTRPRGMNLESRSEILYHHDENGTELGYEATRGEGENWDDMSPEEHERYRDSDPRIDVKHMTNYTDDSLEAPHLDQVTETRHVSDGFGASPEFVHTPVAVESAVASLMEPSILDTRSALSAPHSQADSLNRSAPDSPLLGEIPIHGRSGSERGSPLKYEYDAGQHDEKSFTKRLGAASPPQSVTQSEELDEHHEQYPLDPTVLEENERAPEDYHSQETESEINTNPSIIQGPIGGVSHENRDHWPYDATPPQARDVQVTPLHEGPGAAAAVGAALGTGLGLAAVENKAGYDQGFSQPREHHMDGHIFSTPPGAKDEGYISAANPMSPSVGTPEPRKTFNTLDHANPPLLFDSANLDDDPFTGPSHERHFSGYSHGMASPLYDSATGRGLDRIQSKDIIALMDHVGISFSSFGLSILNLANHSQLTVRDAQRNARDTEILVTLVRSAAEMRTSFEEMKRYIAQQDGMLLQANEKQHERTRTIGGPRPLPLSRSARQLSAAEYGEEIQTKRRNVFRRALKSLSTKSNNDLGKIEDMLEQLLDEVEALRANQEGPSVGTAPGTQPASINSNGQTGASNQDGYEPEGQAGTGSFGDRSGYTSNSSRPVPDAQAVNVRRGSENRISTVHEDDEIEAYEKPLLERDVPYEDRVPSQEERGASEPVVTPTRVPVASGALSNETTPRRSDDKSRKHKSSSSSFFPKISRWSKTTASSVGENIRNSIQQGRKERPMSEASRSGSDLAGVYNHGDYYDPNGDDRLRSNYTLDEEEQQEKRPPSPLVPSQVSEGPKYRGHRDSLNLQHPQPRQGPTDRYQSHLEAQAQNFDPTSPTSEIWGSNPSLHINGNPNRYSGGGGRLTPISDAGYSETSSANAPPRPPKIKDQGPLVPQRPPKIKDDVPPTYADGFNARAGGILSPGNQPPQRKPTGPRPITSSGQYSPGNIKRNRYRGSPNQIDDDDDDY
jgi:hypothetical protein